MTRKQKRGIAGVDYPFEEGPPYESWLCNCGNGSLGATPVPERCPMCNFPLREHFEEQAATGESNDEEESDA